MRPQWARDLILGGRLAWSGGRDGWIRAVMTAFGVGVGVAMLLAASSIPAMLQTRHDRGVARDDLLFGSKPDKGANTLLVAIADTSFREAPIRGRVLQPEGPAAPVPPGLTANPKPGDVVVSPALADLLASPGGALLKPRLPYRIAGTIGQPGLAGPRELAFYVGSDRLANEPAAASRIDHFGDQSSSERLDPVLILLIIIIFVVLLLPIGVFIAAAIRFGDERRDRRLAALRLVGADGRMTRRIAAGEAVLTALLGVLAGVAFFTIGIQFIERITLMEISVFTSDVRPNPVFAALIVLAVPTAAVVVTLVTLRRIVIEPLGVVRRSGGARRRAWWRLALPVLGLALLYPLVGGVSNTSGRPNPYQVAGGAVLLLLSVTALLPWVVEAAVRRIGGGGVAWQLAVRRLQLNSGTSARMVNGIAVAAAGGIALQMLFGAAADNYVTRTGQDTGRAQVEAYLGQADNGAAAAAVATKFRQAPGVRDVVNIVRFAGTDPNGPLTLEGERPTFALFVADCPALREVAGIDRCADGDLFLVDKLTGSGDRAPTPRPGQRVEIGSLRWTVPASAQPAQPKQSPLGQAFGGVYATPSAIDVSALPGPSVQAYLRVDPAAPDVFEHVRNAAAAVSPTMNITVMHATGEATRFANVRRGLFIGLVVTLLLIGVSLLVSTLEQLQERRKLLAVLVAFGARRSTMSWSVLWQTAVPVLLGLGLAIIAGGGLGAVLLAMVNRPLRFDWASIAGITGVAAGVVLLVTAASLPAVWRLMRPEALRAE